MTYTTDFESHHQPNLARGLDFSLLNALLPEVAGWRQVRANKTHDDMFGDVVRSGAMYYTRRAGPGFADVLKLSQPSMERLLAAVFFENEGLRKLSADEVERRKTSLIERMGAVVAGEQQTAL